VYYILRQDKNQVLVFNAANHTKTATLRTCTKPMGMAITFDQQNLLVGCDESHYMSVFDLDTLQAQAPVAFPQDYVQSVAASSNAILASIRSGLDGHAAIDVVDLVYRTGSALPALGVYQNKLGTIDTVLASSSNGSSVLIASQDGAVMIYDANTNSFTVSRKDFSSLAGSYAASNFGQYVVGNNLLDSSGVPQLTFPVSTGTPSGFAFVGQSGYFTTAPDARSPGVISQVDLATGGMIRPTAMVEAPILGTGTPAGTAGTVCRTVITGTTTTEICTTTTGGIVTTTTKVCTGGTNSSACTTTTSSAPGAPTHAWTRSIAPLPDQSALINLTTSGFTVLPWTYASSVAPPLISKVASAADGKSQAAPGGLISLFGSQLSPTNLATREMPLPTALANSCLTVNGQPMPLIFVSPTQINAQMPSQAIGNVTLIVHTPGGVSDNYNLAVAANAPAVFLSGQAGPVTNLPTVVRTENNLLVTDSNPVHRRDNVVIYLTGLGQTSPSVPDGMPAPGDTLAVALTTPVVDLAGVTLPVTYAGLAPGEVGVYQINATVPTNVPEGLGIPLNITQGDSTQTVNVRVVP